MKNHWLDKDKTPEIRLEGLQCILLAQLFWDEVYWKIDQMVDEVFLDTCNTTEAVQRIKQIIGE